MLGLVPAAFAEPLAKDRGQELAALEKKLIGVWHGRTGCAGNFCFRNDGTYTLTDYGPAPYDTAGTWRVRWDALPPTLILTCVKSEVPDEMGKATELKLTRLDDQGFAVKHEGQDEARYERAKK